MSEFDINDTTSVNIRDDMVNTLDKACCSVATAGDFVAVCTTTGSTTFYTNGAATATASCNMSDKNVRDIVDFMKGKFIPKFGGGKDYVGILSIGAQRGLYDYLQALMAYTTPEFMYNSEIGRYYNARMVEETNILSNILGSGTQYGEAVFLGGDSLMEAVAMPEELRRKLGTDYGRSQGICWIYTGAFKRVWDYSTDTREHIVFVTSK